VLEDRRLVWAGKCFIPVGDPFAVRATSLRTLCSTRVGDWYDVDNGAESSLEYSLEYSLDPTDLPMAPSPFPRRCNECALGTTIRFVKCPGGSRPAVIEEYLRRCICTPAWGCGAISSRSCASVTATTCFHLPPSTFHPGRLRPYEDRLQERLSLAPSIEPDSADAAMTLTPQQQPLRWQLRS